MVESSIVKTTSSDQTINVEAPRAAAFIGAIVMILEGIMYLRLYLTSPVWYIIVGTVLIAGGVILLLVLGVGFEVNIHIPYEWWLLLAIGGGVLTIEIINWVVLTGGIFGIPRYMGALLVGIAAFLKLGLDDKMNLKASQFVIFVGAIIIALISVLAMIGGAIIIPLIGVACGVLLILTCFDVLPYEWWLVLILGATPFVLGIHTPGASVVLTGLVLMVADLFAIPE
ncbi:MAG: hypothetical protein ACTSQQ_05535 [Candidatus Helarchaeota archaeon]